MMKKTMNLVKLQLQIYFKGTRFVMPLVGSAVFLYMMYSVKPLDIVSSFLISGVFLFLLMVWVGLSATFGEDTVTEQLVFLRVQSGACYYVSKVLFLICIALLADILYAAFPVIQNLLNGSDLFTRPVIMADVGNALLLQGGSAFAGAALGSFLHPRILKNRKTIIIVTVFLAVLSVTSTAITEMFPAMKWILWVLPPVMVPAKIYGNAEFFALGQTGILFLVLIFYAIVYSVIKSTICHKNKF